MGQTLGERYQIIEKIGEGGMGVVYLAEDLRLKRKVAVKRLQVMGKASDLEIFQQRFEQEALEMAGFQHPHIVNVYDFGHDDEGVYLVLEYMPGGSLSRTMKEWDAISAQEASVLLLPIAEALKEIHDQEMIHRDIKPSNILFDRYGNPKLSDFGVVKMIAGDDAKTLTDTGAALGTPAYMAPELITGELSPSVDFYALSVVFYELVVGKKPFQGRTPAETMTMQKHEPLPNPLSVKPTLSQDAVQFLEIALAKDPADRFTDIDKYLAALKAMAEGRRNVNLEQPNRRSILWTTLVVSAVFLVSLILGVMFDWVSFGRPEATQQAIVHLTTETIIPTSTNISLPTETPTVEPTVTVTPIPTPTTTTFKSGAIQVRPIDHMPMRYVAAGEFIMGNPDGADDERPVHTVFLNGYWVDQYLVSNDQFTAFVEETGHVTGPEVDGYAWAFTGGGDKGWEDVPGTDWRHPQGPDSNIDELGRHPVVHANWFDAEAYCTWVGGRLLTEAEWEKAARGIDARLYPWGNESPTGTQQNFADVNLEIDRSNKKIDDGYRLTNPVNAYSDGISPYGVYDMTGNVLEWVADYYDENYYTNSPYNNPEGPVEGVDKVTRGGFWYYGAKLNTTTNRGWWDPSLTFYNYGFRCAFDQVP